MKKMKFRFGRIVLMLIIFIMPFVNLILQGEVARINYEVESMKKENTVIAERNEQLNIKISELTSFERIQEIVKEEGLTYNSDNVLSVSNND